MTIVSALHGHNSPETAYLIEDYPYGRVLRCKKRIWLETGTKGAGKGQVRACEQTTNPKKDNIWNKVHHGIYQGFILMYLDEIGQVQFYNLYKYVYEKHLENFVRLCWRFLNEEEKTAVRLLALNNGKTFQLEIAVNNCSSVQTSTD